MFTSRYTEEAASKAKQQKTQNFLIYFFCFRDVKCLTFLEKQKH